ncbi:ribosomal L7Ae/L30e/S12e/Gadd45 family protein [Candidatus Woesearchaeota archaeon]|nr:ribosomal L7Ae/L30e/S12e/Gadd45 family protein [Candidatus Woesearchaeota archaeon]
MALIEIKKNLKSKRLVFGTELTVKQIKLGNVSKVFLSSNCPDSVKKDISYYSGTGGCSVESLEVLNEELGVICKKPFSVSVVGLLKQ